MVVMDLVDVHCTDKNSFKNIVYFQKKQSLKMTLSNNAACILTGIQAGNWT